MACNDVPSECEKRCEDDQRHEDLGDTVNKPLDGSFAGLCVADQPGDARERGVLANPLCLDDQATRSVHGGPSHDTAWGNIHRQRLASQHGLINGRGSRHHHTICCDAFPRSNHELLANLELLNRDADFLGVSQNCYVFCAQVEKFLQRLRGTSLRAGLKPASQQQEDDNHGGGVQVNVMQTTAAM